MTPVLPLWLEFIKALAPLLAAFLAAGVGAWVAHKFGRIQEGIARQQAATAAAAAKTAKSKLKLDLFERRYEMYELTIRAIESIELPTEDQDVKDMNVLHELRKARWIFGDDVHNFIHQVAWPALLKYRGTLKELQNAKGAEQLAIASQKMREKHMLLFDISKEATELFSPYIQLEN